MTNTRDETTERKYIDEFVDRLRKQIYIEDEELVHIVLSTAAANNDPIPFCLVMVSSGKHDIVTLVIVVSDQSLKHPHRQGWNHMILIPNNPLGTGGQSAG